MRCATCTSDRGVRDLQKSLDGSCYWEFSSWRRAAPDRSWTLARLPPAVGGTISGIVWMADSSITAENRHVTVTNVRTATRYEAQTAVDGGYTIQVPEGTYHIEIALEPGELYARRPENTHISKGDLDLHLDFVIAAK